MNSNIRGNTKLYGVIGDPIEHSISPEIHNSVFEGLDQNSVYLPLNIKLKYLKEGVQTLKSTFAGFNVTIPHKQSIIKYLDEVEDQAKQYGAVNTVKIQDGQLKGFNTDGLGFSKSLDINNINVTGKKVLLLGAGGAGRVVAHELLKKGAKLAIATRSEDKARELIEELEVFYGVECCIYENISDIKDDYQGVVNGTPIGMAPKIDALPVAEKILEHTEFVYDLIYNPHKTKFIKTGEKYGAKGINGLAMLFYQAIRAQEIWNEFTFEDKETMPIYREIEQYLKNKFD